MGIDVLDHGIIRSLISDFTDLSSSATQILVMKSIPAMSLVAFILDNDIAVLDKSVTLFSHFYSKMFRAMLSVRIFCNFLRNAN